jgi:hypothetical protein
MPPGSAMPSRRAAMLTPSPKMSCGSTITSPILMPTRKARRFSSASSIVRSWTQIPTQPETPRLHSEILRETRRRCFLRAGHHGARSTALQHPSEAWSNARALPPRHCALDANSPRHRRPISPTICVRPDLAASCTMAHANLFARQLYYSSGKGANIAFRRTKARAAP